MNEWVSESYGEWGEKSKYEVYRQIPEWEPRCITLPDREQGNELKIF